MALDGVRDGAAAVDGEGLVGRIVGVGEQAARVILLTDFNSRVPVKVLPSGRRAILSGQSTDAPRLSFLETMAGVAPGDRVMTTGDGGVFPPDLLVGNVAVIGESGARIQIRRIMSGWSSCAYCATAHRPRLTRPAASSSQMQTSPQRRKRSLQNNGRPRAVIPEVAKLAGLDRFRLDRNPD